MTNLGYGKITKKPLVWFEDRVVGRLRITIKSKDKRYEKSKPFIQEREKELRKWV